LKKGAKPAGSLLSNTVGLWSVKGGCVRFVIDPLKRGGSRLQSTMTIQLNVEGDFSVTGAIIAFWREVVNHLRSIDVQRNI